MPKTNASLDASCPVSNSKPANALPSTSPAFAPVMFQRVWSASAAGPISSSPAPVLPMKVVMPVKLPMPVALFSARSTTTAAPLAEKSSVSVVGAAGSDTPPSIAPLTPALAPVSRNLSSLLPPVRFSMPVKTVSFGTGLTVSWFSTPAPRPVSFQVFLMLLPISVSAPAPPAIDASVGSVNRSVNSSLPLPPVTDSIATKWLSFSVPAPSAESVHTVSAFGPVNVSAPLPPSSWPLIEPSGPKVKASASPRPVRFSMLAKLVLPLSVPASAPKTSHVFAWSVPNTVSMPSPPVMVIGLASADATRKLSSPPRPLSRMLCTPTAAVP